MKETLFWNELYYEKKNHADFRFIHSRMYRARLSCQHFGHLHLDSKFLVNYTSYEQFLEMNRDSLFFGLSSLRF